MKVHTAWLGVRNKPMQGGPADIRPYLMLLWLKSGSCYLFSLDLGIATESYWKQTDRQTGGGRGHFTVILPNTCILPHTYCTIQL